MHIYTYIIMAGYHVVIWVLKKLLVKGSLLRALGEELRVKGQLATCRFRVESLGSGLGSFRHLVLGYIYI